MRSLPPIEAEAASRRVFRYFAVGRRLVATLQRCTDPSRSSNPAASERACPPNLTHALGSESPQPHFHRVGTGSVFLGRPRLGQYFWLPSPTMSAAMLFTTCFATSRIVSKDFGQNEFSFERSLRSDHDLLRVHCSFGRDFGCDIRPSMSGVAGFSLLQEPSLAPPHCTWDCIHGLAESCTALGYS